MAFGCLLCFSQIRFIYKGWIEACYILPEFHFTYQYFGWVKPFGLTTMYVIVILSAVSALCIGLGLLYRFATPLFFLSFTYLELIEKSWYLNHYYFVSLVAFLLIWVPAHRKYSLDAKIFSKIKIDSIPLWTIFIFQLQLAIVYFFGGIAKLKSDWLLEAQPLKIWLKTRTDIPILGRLFEYDITPYIFSWTGMFYDLLIPFLLWNRKSRPVAYIFVVTFHVLTYLLFNIGMFPWLMIAGSLIFITSEEWILLFKKLNIGVRSVANHTTLSTSQRSKKPILIIITFFFIIQLILPWRHFALTNNVLWTENGFRFAWHVMVMEKNGFTEFTVTNKDTNNRFTVYPSQYLSVIQEKQMSFQPDMIWQFAHYIRDIFEQKGISNIAVTVNSKVSLNGRTSRTYIDPEIDLLLIRSVDDIYDHIIKY
ncbi:HTTM domain-containing protein [Aquimarina addita]|uniref:HTTM domain-containing protein n=2 Tax=Aquimarina addita TaxID=870485 RepID=A0ABP6UK13_9FLAO